MNNTEKIDPYKRKELYLKWKSETLDEKGNIKGNLKNINKKNSDLIIKYILDMELGLNVSVTKGSRSFARLVTVRDKVRIITEKLENLYNIKDLTQTSEEAITKLFNGMRTGQILTNRNQPYKATADYVKAFKAFWHWYIKVNKKQDIKVKDITIDLDTTRAKPKWVYLTEDQFKQLRDHAKYEYKVLITFLWFTGIRSPTELINTRVNDLTETKEGYYILHIREEISKTFGRKIKLLMCTQTLKEYLKRKGLSGNDQLFNINPRVVNQYLKRLGKKVLGEGLSEAGESYSNLTMYDFRHNSCCYWLPRYKSESALKYRFAWKSSDKIHYYSELLGMKDTISQEDILVDVTASEIQQQLFKTKLDNELLNEKIDSMNESFLKVMKTITSLKTQIDTIQNE